MKQYRAELTGVFGDPVDDNPTGVLTEAGFAAKNLNYRYLTLKVLPKDLETAMRSVRAFNMKGINLTMPHKIAVIPMLDELSQAASIIGAVNTVIHKDGKLYGENTDGKGFILALKDDGVSVEGKTITILGSGGAARAIAVEAALAGAGKINIINRTAEKGMALCALLRDKTSCESEFIPWTETIAVPDGTDILINGTPLGLKPDDQLFPDIDYDTILPGMHACDVVFNPAQTVFLTKAAEKGAVTHSGLGMLVRQGALNFTLWTGVEAPLEVMTKALEAEFAEE